MKKCEEKKEEMARKMKFGKDKEYLNISSKAKKNITKENKDEE